MGKQIQRAGNQSINVQADTVNVGISYDDARQIAQDLFDANCHRLAGVAKETAKTRANEFVDLYMETLAEKNPEGIETASDPDMQYVLFEAEKEYARSGDRDLADILVDILVDRSREQGRSLRQIVLNESIHVVPKLTSDQIDILSLVLLVRYTRSTVLTDHDSFRQYLGDLFMPFFSRVELSNSSFQHLEYAGCGTVRVTAMMLEGYFCEAYPGLFANGYTNDERDRFVLEENIPSVLFTPCLNDSNKVQVNALDEGAARKLATLNQLDDQRTSRLIALMKKNAKRTEEIKELVCRLVPGMKEIFEVWNDSSLKHLNLTSVGIAIGHANARRKIKDCPPLDVWLSRYPMW